MIVDKRFDGSEELEIAEALEQIAEYAPIPDAVTIRDAAIDIRFLVRNVLELLKEKTMAKLVKIPKDEMVETLSTILGISFHIVSSAAVDWTDIDDGYVLLVGKNNGCETQREIVGLNTAHMWLMQYEHTVFADEMTIMTIFLSMFMESQECALDMHDAT